MCALELHLFRVIARAGISFIENNFARAAYIAFIQINRARRLHCSYSERYRVPPALYLLKTVSVRDYHRANIRSKRPKQAKLFR